MRQFLKRVFLSIIFVSWVVVSQAQGPVEEIGGSIREGNIGGIARFFDNAVSITIGSSQSTYSRSQAEMVLRDFFNKNEPKGFEVAHSGGGNSSQYAIGTLQTSGGDYKTYFTLKLKDGNYILQEIRFEK